MGQQPRGVYILERLLLGVQANIIFPASNSCLHAHAKSGTPWWPRRLRALKDPGQSVVW